MVLLRKIFPQKSYLNSAVYHGVSCHAGESMKNLSRKISKFEELLDILSGKVFHVTRAENLSKILKEGGLIPNLEKANLSPFGNTENGFFRNLGCVSFFDYRGCGTSEWEEHAHKCSPFLAFNTSETISFLFLSEEYYENLVSWRKWKELEQWSMRVVPYVEIGFKGKVPLKAISEIWSVEYRGS